MKTHCYEFQYRGSNLKGTWTIPTFWSLKAFQKDRRPQGLLLGLRCWWKSFLDPLVPPWHWCWQSTLWVFSKAYECRVSAPSLHRPAHIWQHWVAGEPALPSRSLQSLMWKGASHLVRLWARHLTSTDSLDHNQREPVAHIGRHLEHVASVTSQHAVLYPIRLYTLQQGNF